ncbi:AAA family ATPase [Archangium primigenium]|uniref:AAA family ATPase n=1 Tax=[Archangium] primigenium TaxID=2792470 RepID=UPI001955FDD4|nr:AAA family ATPase [Archangium primigenium]MBM7112451.1 AAA family ATPase [Archangium primigenium]
MYLLDLHVSGLKLLRDFRLDLRDAQGQPRMWTVLIGENGLCKTSILQAIAMAASGYIRANQLADVPSLPDRRREKGMTTINANFTFGMGRHLQRQYPERGQHLEKPPLIDTSLFIDPGYSVFDGASFYRDENSHQLDDPSSPVEVRLIRTDPVEKARATNLPQWFVAGYGTSRLLPRPFASDKAEDPALSRLNSLFDRGRLIGTGFAEMIENPEEFTDALNQALVSSQLLPRAKGVEIRGRGSAKNPNDVVSKHSVDIKMGKDTLKLPATWLSQGYQSTIAWIADIIGQMFWENDGAIALSDMEGLVLVDEIDLHLHPKWQLGLIPTLKRVFPKLQFIVTTHSPMVLPGLSREEIVILGQDEEGNVIAQESPESPSLLTGSEIYRTFFGIDRLHPSDLGKDLQRYSFLIADPLRSDAEEQEMRDIQKRLAAAGVDPGWEPVPRMQEPT